MEHLNRVRGWRGSRVVAVGLAVVALLVPLWVIGPASANPSHPSRPSQGSGPRPTIVLVHGDWADASSWNAVTERLQRRGYTVVAPPNPLRGPSSDAAYVAAFLQTIPGPIVLAAHS
jgi:pimeloyl-ACP methyl ester carboxylesterase